MLRKLSLECLERGLLCRRDDLANEVHGFSLLIKQMYHGVLMGRASSDNSLSI